MLVIASGEPQPMMRLRVVFLILISMIRGPKEVPMRAFILALVAAAVLATAASYTLPAFQMTAAQNMTTGSARLDQQEAVNAIGRQG
jgi:hypothetical protein